MYKIGFFLGKVSLLGIFSALYLLAVSILISLIGSVIFFCAVYVEHNKLPQMFMYSNDFLTFQIYQRFDAESIVDVDDARLAYFSQKVC